MIDQNAYLQYLNGTFHNQTQTPTTEQGNQNTTGNNGQTEQPSQTVPAKNQFAYQDYAASDRVNQAQTALDQIGAMKPGDYQSPWMQQMDKLYGQIADRKPFQYNINEDALYNQYKDQYIRGGQLAMADTMGKAAALTGGYGSSYAQQVGQQAFQGYLQGLNDKVPQLAQMAFDQYNQQGSDLYKQYSLLADREQQDYGRYQNAYNQWLAERNYLNQVMNDERAFDYGKYQAERDFGYQGYRDQVADEQWQAQFDEAKRQWDQLHPVVTAPAVIYQSAPASSKDEKKDYGYTKEQLDAALEKIGGAINRGELGESVYPSYPYDPAKDPRNKNNTYTGQYGTLTPKK